MNNKKQTNRVLRSLGFGIFAALSTGAVAEKPAQAGHNTPSPVGSEFGSGSFRKQETQRSLFYGKREKALEAAMRDAIQKQEHWNELAAKGQIGSGDRDHLLKGSFSLAKMEILSCQGIKNVRLRGFASENLCEKELSRALEVIKTDPSVNRKIAQEVADRYFNARKELIEARD